jgi:CheY-like chemotaxis protein
MSISVADDRPSPRFRKPNSRSGSAVANVGGGTAWKTTVLVVEDDAAIREVLAEGLEEAGYRVTTAENGQKALADLRAAPTPDVIVLDLMMPVMDGWEFRVEQKKDPRLAPIPVVVLSANASTKARAIDAAAFIGKPPSPDSVELAIRRVLAEKEAARVEHADRLASLGMLTAGIGHEIGNPLTYVISNLQEVLTQLPQALAAGPTEIPERVGEALEGVRRIADIVRNIQTVARVAGPQPKVSIDLRNVARNAVRIVDHEIRQRARLELKLDPTGYVMASAGRLEQVALNLLMNAVHAVSARPSPDHVIKVTTLNTPSGRARLEVEDTGPGGSARAGGPHFRAVLYDKGSGRRYRTRSVHQPRDHRGIGGRDGGDPGTVGRRPVLDRASIRSGRW